MRLLEPLLTEARRTGRLEAQLAETEERVARAVSQIETLAKENIELMERLREAEGKG